MESCGLHRQASAQAQQNKILISGTRGAFPSGKRGATDGERLVPGTGQHPVTATVTYKRHGVI